MISNDIKVSVLMLTYNHEKFIAQAIESVLMQNTNFKIELIIGDDCSTDNTKNIILSYKERYPDKIKYIFQNINVGPVKNFIDTLNLCSGKYIAFLEGDDYWIDPYKLQRQVDFLEAHSEYGLVHTNYLIINEKKKKIIKDDSKIKDGNIFYWLYEGNYIIGTLTVMLRNDLVIKIFDNYNKNKLKNLSYDYWLWLKISQLSKIKYLDNITAVYNSHPNSLTRNKYYEKKLQKDWINIKFDIALDILLNKNLFPRDNYEKNVLTKNILSLLISKNIHIVKKLKLTLLIMFNANILFLLILHFKKLISGKKGNT